MFEPKGTLDDIVPSARPAFEELLRQATALGLQPRIRGAGRTCAMQNALAAQGRQVTGAAMCRSMHVLHRALDIDLSPSTCASYTQLGQIWEQMGGVWGGRWVSQFGPCGDAGHFHWYPKPGGGSYSTPPQDVCPNSLQSVEECEQRRTAYLLREFASPPLSMWDVAGAVLLVVGTALVVKSLH